MKRRLRPPGRSPIALLRWVAYRLGARPRLGSILHSPSLALCAPENRRERRVRLALAEEGRLLASMREDLVIAGVDPRTLLVPLYPEPPELLYDYDGDSR